MTAAAGGTDDGVLIVGAGQAAFTLAVALRAEGYAGPVRVLGDEPHLPYQRPPLSKTYMDQAFRTATLTFQAESYYADNGIGLLLGHRAVAVDRERRTVATADGASFGYGHLVLATGARNRRLGDVCPGGDTALDLRTVDDAELIRTRLHGADRVVVIGAGFLGLEFAAAAAKAGGAVTVIEVGDTLMGRVISAPVAAAFRAKHEELGVVFRLSTALDHVQTLPDGRHRVVIAGGEVIDADLLVGSIGVVPNIELAAGCGLEVRNGIVVDAFFGTADPAVSAVGDCASFTVPLTGEHARIESVQNAIDTARCLARRLAGRPSAYDAVPWFWSDQGGLKLQIAGLAAKTDTAVVRGDPADRAFSVYRFRGDRLTAVESVARPADHMAARRLLGGRVDVTPEQAADTGVDLKALAAGSVAAATVVAATP